MIQKKNADKSTPWGYKKVFIKDQNRYVYVQDDYVKSNKGDLISYFKKFTKFPSVMDCLVSHKKRPYMFVCDIKDAFGSVDIDYFLKQRYNHIFSFKKRYIYPILVKKIEDSILEKKEKWKRKIFYNQENNKKAYSSYNDEYIKKIDSKILEKVKEMHGSVIRGITIYHKSSGLKSGIKDINVFLKYINYESLEEKFSVYRKKNMLIDDLNAKYNFFKLENIQTHIEKTFYLLREWVYTNYGKKYLGINNSFNIESNLSEMFSTSSKTYKINQFNSGIYLNHIKEKDKEKQEEFFYEVMFENPEYRDWINDPHVISFGCGEYEDYNNFIILKRRINGLSSGDYDEDIIVNNINYSSNKYYDYNTEKKINYFHKEGGLIQGSPESPILFEHFCNETIDKELKKFSDKYNLVYTRYRDDLIFSSKKRSIGKKIRKEIRFILSAFGFETNIKKDKIINLNKKKAIILGVDVLKTHWDITDEKYSEALKECDTSYHEGIKGWQKYITNFNPQSAKKKIKKL